MFTSPLYITLNNKKHYLNLNLFRNWHYQLSNKLKKEYKAIMFNQLFNKKFEGNLIVEFTLFTGNKKRVDLDNLLSIQTKFFNDCLVELGCIEDDSVLHIVGNRHIYGGYEKGKGRVEIKIYKVEY